MRNRNTILTVLTLLAISFPGGAARSETTTNVESGTMQADCAPWGGDAFTINLNSGTNATVYGSFTDLESSGQAKASYNATMQCYSYGCGIINKCNALEVCQQYAGTIDLQLAGGGDRVTGEIIITDLEEHYRFTVVYDREYIPECTSEDQ